MNEGRRRSELCVMEERKIGGEKDSCSVCGREERHRCVNVINGVTVKIIGNGNKTRKTNPILKKAKTWSGCSKKWHGNYTKIKLKKKIWF